MSSLLSAARIQSIESCAPKRSPSLHWQRNRIVWRISGRSRTRLSRFSGPLNPDRSSVCRDSSEPHQTTARVIPLRQVNAFRKLADRGGTVVQSSVSGKLRSDPAKRRSRKPLKSETRFHAKTQSRKGDLSAVFLCASPTWREAFSQQTIDPGSWGVRLRAGGPPGCARNTPLTKCPSHRQFRTEVSPLPPSATERDSVFDVSSPCATLEPMRLLSGPAGSGKTTYILDRFRLALGGGDSAIRVLVPTATMARHLQNGLAREGLVFRGRLIQTLADFVRDYAGSAAEVSPAVLYLLVEEAARRVGRPEFSRVTRFHGFSNSLARAIEEFASAGCDSARLATCLPDVPLGEAFLAVYREVDRELARRGLAMRARRLELAAAQIDAQGLNGISTICIDGFHALPDPELRVVAALGRHADLILTLGDEDLTPALRARLTAMGVTEERLPARRARPAMSLVKAPGIDREVEEIARRILQQAAAGRPFREMGVIVRAPDIYVPTLRSTD